MSLSTPEQFQDLSALYNVPRKSLTDEVYNRLTGMITSLNLEPGSRLNLKQLRSLFNVSQAPLRDAIQRLVAEGLIISEPQLGYYVIKLEKTDISDLYGVRTALESLSLTKSIDKIPKDRLLSIRNIFLEEKDLELENTIGNKFDHNIQYKQADWALHYTLIVGYSESQIFSHISKYILNFFQMVWNLNIARREATNEHVNIIDAILDRNLEQAMSALTHHLKEAEKSKLYQLEKSSAT